MKREHGAAYPKGTKSVTAPATVSEELSAETTGPPGREGAERVDPQVRRPAIKIFFPGRGVRTK
ncbi:hypothetical protein MACH18_11730 [Phaeobacter italicus]|nr:hypothetical protein MACH18_11730 [Phaeobacter italicus]